MVPSTRVLCCIHLGKAPDPDSRCIAAHIIIHCCLYIQENGYCIKLPVSHTHLSLIQIPLKAREHLSYLLRLSEVGHGIGYGIMVLQPQQRR